MSKCHRLGDLGYNGSLHSQVIYRSYGNLLLMASNHACTDVFVTRPDIESVALLVALLVYWVRHVDRLDRIQDLTTIVFV